MNANIFPTAPIAGVTSCCCWQFSIFFGITYQFAKINSQFKDAIKNLLYEAVEKSTASSVTVTRVTSIGHINKIIINSKMPAAHSRSTVSIKPGRKCVMWQVSRPVFVPINWFRVFFFVLCSSRSILLCDILLVLSFDAMESVARTTFPSILLCIACFIHLPYKVANVISEEEKNASEFIPFNRLFFCDIQVSLQLWLLLLQIL